MTLRFKLTATALTAAALLAAPAFADGHGDEAHEMKNKAKAAMTSPAAKAPLQQQKAEDLMQKAEQQMEAGNTEAAMNTAKKGVKMEIKAEQNVMKAEKMSGDNLELMNKGETSDLLTDTNATVLVNTDPNVQVIVKDQATTMAPAPAMPAASIACPYGTTAQPNGTCMITGDYKGK